MYLYFDDSMKKTVPYLKSLEFYYIEQKANIIAIYLPTYFFRVWTNHIKIFGNWTLCSK